MRSGIEKLFTYGHFRAFLSFLSDQLSHSFVVIRHLNCKPKYFKLIFTYLVHSNAFLSDASLSKVSFDNVSLRNNSTCNNLTCNISLATFNLATVHFTISYPGCKHRHLHCPCNSRLKLLFVGLYGPSSRALIS